MDPICNAYKAIAQRSGLLPGENVVIFGTGPLGLFSVQIAKIMGALNIVVVGLEEDVKVRGSQAAGSYGSGERFRRGCGATLPGDMRRK